MSNTFYRNLRDIIPENSLTDKYLVLDLDETLVSTQDEDLNSLLDIGIMNNPKYLHIRERIYYFILENIDSPGSGSKIEMWGITRPHISKFLLFCSAYFKGVFVWSAGKREYVDAIVDYIFQDFKRPEIVFSADETKQKDGQVLKPLDILYKKYPFMNSKNTFMVDDNRYAIRENVSNSILIPPYKPLMSSKDFSMNDTTLIQIIKWLKLNHVKNEKDLRKLNKDIIFNIPISTYKEILKYEK